MHTCLCADPQCTYYGCKNMRIGVPLKQYQYTDKTTREVIPVDEIRVRQIVREELKKIVEKL